MNESVSFEKLFARHMLHFIIILLLFFIIIIIIIIVVVYFRVIPRNRQEIYKKSEVQLRFLLWRKLHKRKNVTDIVITTYKEFES